MRRLALVALWALVVAPASAVDRGEADAELEGLRRAIEGSRERVGGLEREERALFERLDEIDRHLDTLFWQVVGAREQADRARARLEEAERDAKRAAERLEETRTAMARRVVALYKAGETGPVRLLFSSTSLRELLSRVSALRRLLAYDAELVAGYRQRRDELETSRLAAHDATRERDAAVVELRERSEMLAREKSAKRRMLARVREDRVQERAMLVELEQAARALEETLSALGSAGRRRSEGLDRLDFSARRGRLLLPVDAEIQQGFGRVVDSEFLTQTFRKGVEFAVEMGDTVRAVAPGEVRFAGWFRGYGRIVILDHGDRYFTVYGHLSEISVELGDRVEEAQLLGRAGETGSLTGPSLYFEVRRGSEPLDPAEWLGSG